MPLEVVDLDLYRELSDLDRLIRAQAEAKALSLQILIDARTPWQMRGTTACLRHIVTNLAANAVKFTESGHVRIAVTTTGDVVEGHVTLRIDVIDTGIGISDEAVERIFDQFTQEDQAIARRFGGAGLGLAICKQLTDLVGGRLGVETKLGQGSRFWVELPFELPESAAEATTRVTTIWKSADGAVDPDLAGRFGLVGPTVVANSLESALSHRDALANRGVTSLIVDADGDPNGRSKLPSIVAGSTFDVQQVDRDWSGCRCMLVEQGAASQIANAAHFYDTFANTDVGFRSGSADERDQGERQPTRSLTVLVAEDNPVNRRVIAMILRRAGHQVDLAVNGDEASEILAGKRYDIAILDVNMPGTSGIDVVRLFRFQEMGGARTPILALTADATESTRETCLAAGMDQVITKPVEPDVLLHHVHKLTATETTAVEPVESDAESKSLVENPGSVTDLTTHPRFRAGQAPVIDQPAIDALCDLDRSGAFLREVIGEFLADATQLLDTMARSVDERDVGSLRDSAHALKSTAAHVGALRMQAICSAFQRASRRDNLAMAQDTVDALNNELASFRKAIDEELKRQGEEDQRL